MKTIRDYMKNKGYDAIVIPTADPHQSEYPAPAYRLRAHLSGFTGSAGTLVVTKESAGLWTDGRYELQGEKQLRGTGIDLYCTAYPETKSIESFLQELPKDAVIAVDGWRMSVSEYRKIKEAVTAELCPDLHSPDLWPDGPALPKDPITQPIHAAAGGTVADKLTRVREEVQKAGAQAVWIGATEDIAWLLNLRGSDVYGTPVFYAYFWLGEEDAALFIDPEKLPADIQEDLHQKGIQTLSYTEAEAFLQKREEKILFDPTRTNIRLYQSIAANRRVDGMNPTTKLKARKTKDEIACMKEAFHKDGIALTNFFYWLEQEGTGHTEKEIAERLLAFRREQPGFSEPSFETIAGYGPNGAIIHYKPEDDSATLENKSLLLLDSGGQYDDGTTDITRTVAMGPLTDEEKRDYTLTLRSHIQLIAARFLKGTRGHVLDGFARYPFWQEGMDYKHGTGHGVGFMLSVHEGPMSISTAFLDVPLEEGHIVSIEPGIYRAGKHGVRIENIVYVEKDTQTEFGEFYRFGILSDCYIDTAPVCTDMLSPKERSWLNAYNQGVYDRLEKELAPDVKDFLYKKTRPVS